MIRVAVGRLAEFRGEAVLRTIRSDLDPTTGTSRELGDRAGPTVRARLELGGDIPVGGAVLTPGGGLPADFVIHVVTCARDEPESPLTVERALRNGLRRAADWEVASLALPPLGTGVGVMELEEAARLQVEILVEHLAEEGRPREITVLVANAYEEDVFTRTVSALAGGAVEADGVAPAEADGADGASTGSDTGDEGNPDQG